MFSAQEPTSIQKMFNQIASKYDFANSILSLGTHWLWKKKLVQITKPEAGQKILDCATGTGDIAFLLEKHSTGKAFVTGVDFSENMLAVALQKANQMGSHAKFQFADVENLPFKDQEFDAATISFGLRNIRDTKQALKELARVVKPGGKVVILEFGQPKVQGIKQMYDLYSKEILPRIGGIISGQRSAYKYLQSSSSKFPCGEELAQLAKSLGVYSSTNFKELSFGIAYIYTFVV